MIFLSSIGSFGIKRIFNSSSNLSTFALDSFSSSLASSFISSSDSSSKSIKLSSIFCFSALYSLYFSTIGVSSFCSFIRSRKRFWLPATSGSFNSCSTVSRRSTKPSNLSNILFSFSCKSKDQPV